MESIIASEYYAPSRQSQFVAGEYYGPRIRTGDYLDVVDMRGTVTVASSLSEDLDDGKTSELSV